MPYWGCSVAVLLGNGDGTFQPAVSYPSGCTAHPRYCRRFQRGNGKLDLAITNWGSGVSILLGNGDGTFQPPVNYAVGSEPGTVIVGDFNRRRQARPGRLQLRLRYRLYSAGQWGWHPPHRMLTIPQAATPMGSPSRT